MHPPDKDYPHYNHNQCGHPNHHHPTRRQSNDNHAHRQPPPLEPTPRSAPGTLPPWPCQHPLCCCPGWWWVQSFSSSHRVRSHVWQGHHPPRVEGPQEQTVAGEDSGRRVDNWLQGSHSAAGKTNKWTNHSTHRACLQPLWVLHHAQAHALLLCMLKLPRSRPSMQGASKGGWGLLWTT